MMKDAQTATDEGRYADALIILQSIDQELTLQTKLRDVEDTINIEVPSSVIEAPLSRSEEKELNEAKVAGGESVSIDSEEARASAQAQVLIPTLTPSSDQQ
jgi:ribosomal protein L12E/L44/L45/RPP1/RPP2